MILVRNGIDGIATIDLLKCLKHHTCMKKRWRRNGATLSSLSFIMEKREKGGSGLVFFTDDVHWEEMKGDAEEKEIREESDGWMVSGMERDLGNFSFFWIHVI